jgi:hypothetical protein
MSGTDVETPIVPAAFSTSNYISVPEVRDGADRKLRPFAVVLGGTILATLDTPEKIARLHKPDVLYLRHADITSKLAFDRTELRQVDTAPDGMPIYGHLVVEEDGVTDALARISCDLIVGYSPEAIADHVRDMVLAAFANVPPYLQGQPLDRPVPAAG